MRLLFMTQETAWTYYERAGAALTDRGAAIKILITMEDLKNECEWYWRNRLSGRI